MEPVIMAAVVALVLTLAIGLWWRGRRGGAAPDEDHSGPPVELDRPAAPPEPHAFDREWLLSRSREFDPTAWDDSPDGAGGIARPAPPVAGSADAEAPQRFDRAFLEQQEQERRDRG